MSNSMQYIIDNEPTIRMTVFIGVLLMMAVLETVFPRKKRVQPRAGRWFTNLALVVIDSISLRVILPIIALTTAQIAARNGWGLFNVIDLPAWVEILLAMIILDMMIYWQHVASHHIPLLWAMHKVHHADRDIDVTTGLRFHPIEIILSMLYKMTIVVVLGPSVIAVLLFELLLNGCAMFNHANFRLPRAVDKAVRLILVTPDVHRIHHSTIVRETNSNYGFSVTWWDRLFGTFIEQPEKGHDDMMIGLEEYQTEKPSNLLWALTVPFMGLSKASKKSEI
ncbi:MAG: sterol desaturase family protein [bacterium]